MNAKSGNTKNILVLARRDHTEGMRVAAGLTIAGHRVRLVFMRAAPADTKENAEQADTLALCEIEPETTAAASALPRLDGPALARRMLAADCVVNI